jgi:hypothetical protein
MIKHIFITFLSLALFSGFLFAKVDFFPDSNTLQSSISDTYQDKNVLISFNRAYSEADYFLIELRVKALTDNKIIKSEWFGRLYGYHVQVSDNFGNDLDFIRNIPPNQWNYKGLMPKEEKLFTVVFRIKPLDNTEYLLLQIGDFVFGNINPFELKIAKPVFEPQSKIHFVPDEPPAGYTEEVNVPEGFRLATSTKDGFEKWQAENKAAEKLKTQWLGIILVLLLLVSAGVLAKFHKRIGLFIRRMLIALCRPQVILWIGISLIVLMCLFPPWGRGGEFDGYAYLFSGGNSYKTHIDLVRLIIQCIIVGLITGGLLYTLNVKKADDGGK